MPHLIEGVLVAASLQEQVLARLGAISLVSAVIMVKGALIRPPVYVRLALYKCIGENKVGYSPNKPLEGMTTSDSLSQAFYQALSLALALFFKLSFSSSLSSSLSSYLPSLGTLLENIGRDSHIF